VSDIKGNNAGDLYMCYLLGGASSLLPFCATLAYLFPHQKVASKKHEAITVEAQNSWRRAIICSYELITSVLIIT